MLAHMRGPLESYTDPTPGGDAYLRLPAGPLRNGDVVGVAAG